MGVRIKTDSWAVSDVMLSTRSLKSPCCVCSDILALTSWPRRLPILTISCHYTVNSVRRAVGGTRYLVLSQSIVNKYLPHACGMIMKAVSL